MVDEYGVLKNWNKSH